MRFHATDESSRLPNEATRSELCEIGAAASAVLDEIQ